MVLCYAVALLMPWLQMVIPDFLREPEYRIVPDGGGWSLQKPGIAGRQPLTISRHTDRGGAEFRKRALPRLRLDAWFVRFDPAANTRSAIADWRAEEDARQIGSEVRAMVKEAAAPGVRRLLDATSLFLARLPGAAGHTAEDGANPTRFVIYIDPFRATSRLHMAATLVHELTHLERYLARGFHANRAAALLPREDFVLLGLADEFAACRAEADLVRSFIDRQVSEEPRRAAKEAMRMPELNWPAALTALLNIDGDADASRGVIEARRRLIVELQPKANRYWEGRRRDPMDPELRRTIHHWYNGSEEWKRIAAERADWVRTEESPLPNARAALRLRRGVN